MVSAVALSLLRCCSWQRAHCEREYRDLRDWYRSSAIADAGNWGVSYEAYRDGFVRAVAGGMALEAGDAVYESAVGAGWLLRGLDETLGLPLRYAGNDVLADALVDARKHCDGAFCVGDSMNLTWVAEDAFDAVLCGYVEAGAAATPEAEAAVTATWVAQMAKRARPGGLVFVGNVRQPRETEDAAAGLYLRPPPGDGRGERVDPAWWRARAADDAHGWRVDPDTVRIAPLADPRLVAAWGPRYSVFMRRRSS